MASSSGSVTAIATLPSGKHIITGSGDIIRLWDLELAKELEGSGKKKLAYKIVVGHQGATGPGLPKSVVSQLCASHLFCSQGYGIVLTNFFFFLRRPLDLYFLHFYLYFIHRC